MRYEKHIDERGFFQEFFRKTDSSFNIEQVSLCSVNAGHTRGRHYHKKTIEIFIIIEGEMRLTLSLVNDKGEMIDDVVADFDIKMNENENSFRLIEPFTYHKIMSEKGCKFLILSNKEFNIFDPDTFKIEENG